MLFGLLELLEGNFCLQVPLVHHFKKASKESTHEVHFQKLVQAGWMISYHNCCPIYAETAIPIHRNGFQPPIL